MSESKVCDEIVEAQTMNNQWLLTLHCNRAKDHEGPHQVSIPDIEDLQEEEEDP